MEVLFPLEKLQKIVYSQFSAVGLSEQHAKTAADIYIRATLRGVGHHDINDIMGRLRALKRKKINPCPEITKIAGTGAIEAYDGDNGLGEICSWYVTRRSMELAQSHGIGFCTIRNSNHFLSPAPFNEMADEQGFLTIVMSKAPFGMSLPGAAKNLIGNNPFGFAATHPNGKLLLDICLAYSSYGKMGQKAKDGERVPEYWGNDSSGKPTTDPTEILKSGLHMPIAVHKGFGIAMLIEILTAVLSGGAILNQNKKETGLPGVYSQTAISIDISKLMEPNEYSGRIKEMCDILKGLFPDIYLPGQRSEKIKKEILSSGMIRIDAELLKKLQHNDLS